MPAKLIIKSGPDAGKVFHLVNDETVTIGRGEDATIRLSDRTVSRSHCTVEYYRERAILKDNASKTGTRFDGDKITEHLLQSDDVFSIGTTKIRFQVTALIPKAGIQDKPDQPVAADVEELFGLVNTKLGHFDIGPVVGVGTSGVVFRARDFKEDREVALKVYTPDFAENDEALQRFIRAVRTMLPMRHSNLVTLYGGGKTGPYCWMAMEYVEGENLKETIERIGTRGKLDWRTALRMCMDLARGLYYIHSEHIIHRNLSPSNILYSRAGVCKLGSLILAKALSGAYAKDVTVGGNFLGDVRYLSPEQVGAGGVVDERSDIYCLGTLFYVLLAGKPPFEGHTQLETATWILQREPTLLRWHDETIPEKLEKLVLKMLAKHPSVRYQTTGELLAELESIPLALPDTQDDVPLVGFEED